MFLADYDVLLAEHLVQGVDLWINTPRRPWEASGTSGMKVLVNGGVNLSELDGWWAEAYSPEIGWALGDGKEHGNDPAWDAAEADALYSLLEREVVPEFYNRNQQGIPTAWVARIRESMAQLTPRYSAERTVREYTTNYYVPAAQAYRRRAENDGAVGTQIVNWRRALDDGWSALRFGELKHTSEEENHVFGVEIWLGGLEPASVHVELYADSLGDQPPIRQQMRSLGRSAQGGDLFTASAPANRPWTDYTPRVVPFHDEASVPLEAPYSLWQR